MSGRRSDTQTGPTAATSSAHTPLAGRAHIVNRDALQDEAAAGPGSLDPRSLQQSKITEVRRWLTRRGIELEVPAGWKFLGIGPDGRSMTFVSDTDPSVPGGGHAIELHQWPMPEDLRSEQLIAAQEELLEEAVALKRVQSWKRHVLGQVPGLLVTGWGPDTGDVSGDVSDEDAYLATDGTGRRALSWRGVVEREGERFLLILALSSPLETFDEARPCYDALLDRAGVWS
ncbi:MAG: hypothetical protein FJ137_20235 [Deltaproteobacteria bacterium]|nr:hypothetical protein [Deltaproteobacteria bacterium]